MNFQQIRDFVNPAVAQATGLQEVDNLAMPVPTAHLMQAGGGGSITVDSELSETSTNPVENRVITAALKNLGSDLYFIIHAEDPSDEEQTCDYILDKTYEEIQQARMNNKVPVIVYSYSPAEGENYKKIYQYWGEYGDNNVIGFYRMELTKAANIRIVYDVIEVHENSEGYYAAYHNIIQEGDS